MWERRAQRTAQADEDRKRRIARAFKALTPTSTPTPYDTFDNTLQGELWNMLWDYQKYKSPPWKGKVEGVIYANDYTCEHVRELVENGEITEDSIVKWLRWRSEQWDSWAYPIPKSVAGVCTRILDYEHWNAPSPTRRPSDGTSTRGGGRNDEAPVETR